MTTTDLDLASTDDLIEAIRRRSKTFFLVRRPLSQEDYDWSMHCGVDGGDMNDGDSVDRVVGLVERAKTELLSEGRPEEGEEEEAE